MILVTGASGFIGKHLINGLLKKYGSEQVVALTSDRFNACRHILHNNYKFEPTYFISSGFGLIETILHAGAFTPKNKSEANDWQQCNSNIINTHALLSAKLPHLKRIIYLSTLDVYGSDSIITEQSPLLPATLYGKSKLYCEQMISAWANETHKIGQILRVGHVYGPGEEKYQKIIPATMKKLMQGQPLEIWGSGNEKRSFIYIDDIINAILTAFDLTENIQPVNLVSGNAISILELVKKIVKISGQKPAVKIGGQAVATEDLIFDPSKMNKFLLSSETSLDEGLLAEWKYVQNL